MKRVGENLVFSPHDFIAFLDGDFAAWMERRQFEVYDGDVSVIHATVHSVPAGDIGPDEIDEETALVHRKGREHEDRFLKSILAEHPDAVVIAEPGDLEAKTIDAMRAAAFMIYQGRLNAGGFFGIPDFLHRVSGQSSLGDFHYEPRDTKLARSAKPHFIVQLCAYAAMLESVQGRRPARIILIPGQGDAISEPTDDFFYYFRNLVRVFRQFQASFDSARPPMPANESSAGRWTTVARRIFEESDHLSRVAGISVGQVKKLHGAGITTMKALAESNANSVPNLSASVFTKLRRQAQAQVRSIGQELPVVDVLPQPPDRPRWGLTALPPPSELDVFFDMEGFPHFDGGLEYLFGASYLENGKCKFVDWWAHDRDQERRAFEGFVDWACDRWRRDPAMHIYHYAPYETTALENLAQKHGSREAKVDDLLRNGVIVDLYRIVQQALVIGTGGYSIKDIECLYRPKRVGAVATAGGSIVAYQNWIDSGEPESWRDSKILGEIRDYNRDDCDSLIGLRDWLLRLRDEQGWQYAPPTVDENQKSDKPPPESAVLAERMLAEAQGGTIAEPECARVQSLLAFLLEHHWREAKPTFWRKYHRLELSEEELARDLNCLSGLERTQTPVAKDKRSTLHEYRFDRDQDTKLAAGARCQLTSQQPINATIHDIQPGAGLITLRLGPSAPEPPPSVHLIPDEYVSAKMIAESIQRCAESWSNGEVRFRAVDDLLHRRPPRVQGHAGGCLIRETDDLIPPIIDLVNRLDESTLCIQGPPGTGKTYTCAKVIVNLLTQGKSVGVTANSHKVIWNVLKMVAGECRKARVAASLFKVGDGDDDPLVQDGSVTLIKSDKAASVAAGPVVIGGTAWVFSRRDFEQKLDYLFIDEAGQFSLANAVGVGPAARNLILVGDQMQLAQPIQAVHPGESGMSALEYLLDGKATIPADVGVLLDRTRRLHPEICSFISEAVYEGRLQSHEEARGRRLDVPAKVQRVRRSTGIQFVPVDHDGNAQSSEEEVRTIQEVVAELLHCRFVDRDEARPLTLADILFVAPYNMQVRKLQAALGDEARIGSVDKFQGQEAPVVIVSMCASSLDDAPRGAEFLLNKNRLNVAISRAQCLAVVVGSPALAAVRCNSIEQMRLVNLYCRLIEYADGLPSVTAATKRT